MKKQLLILTTTFTIVVFVSCTKEKIETQQTNNFEEIPTAKGGNGFTPVSNKGLLGRFEFNNNLKDATGQLADGVSTVNRVLYTEDRKGQANRAIRFNEAYGVDIFNVPAAPDGTVSFWIKYDATMTPEWKTMLLNYTGFHVQQLNSAFVCSHWNGSGMPDQNVWAWPVNDKWHHIAATHDNNELKFYIDGILIGSSPTPAGGGPFPPLDNYLVGYGFGTLFWKGSMDDLRFYERVLSADEVNTLANL